MFGLFATKEKDKINRTELDLQKNLDRQVFAMTHADDHADAMPFSAADIKEFQAQDYAAGAAVCGVMLSIFCVGIVIYSIVVITL